jgi:hypothetical protein
MASPALVLFLPGTGITLNHQQWFADQLVTVERTGTFDTAWLHTADADGVDKVRTVEYLRSASASAVRSQNSVSRTISVRWTSRNPDTRRRS